MTTTFGRKFRNELGELDWATFALWVLCVLVSVAGGATWLAPAQADTVPGRYEVNAGAGTVLDTATGRTWQRGDSGATHTWDEAKAYCAGLQFSTGGWRLPSIEELESIVDVTRPSAPTIDISAFPDTQSTYYWSSTPYVLFSGLAWYVNFSFGISSIIEADTSNTRRVRCVR